MSPQSSRPAGGLTKADRRFSSPIAIPLLVGALGLTLAIFGLSVGVVRVPAAAAAAQASQASPAAPAVPATDSGRFLTRVLHLDDHQINYSVWLPPGYDGGRSWPGILFLHGAGESGTGGVAPTKIGIGPALVAHPDRWPCVVVLPQKPRADEEWWEHESEVLAVLDVCAREFHIDPDRTALTGLSQGGHGAWILAARTPNRWSCLVPICGYGRARTLVPRLDGIPVWAFHGMKDDVVDPRETERIVAALRERRGTAGAEVRLTRVPDVGHAVWDTAYADPGLPAWILAQHRDLTTRAAAANP